MSHEEMAMTTAPEWNWVDRLRRLDSDAWEHMIALYQEDLQRDILRSTRKRGLPDTVAADIEQDTWRTAVQKIHDFEWESIEKFYHWLRVIALNRARMMKRSQGEPPMSLDSLDEQDLDGGLSLDRFLYTREAGHTSPEQEILRRERVQVLDRALRTLKPRDREIVLRRMICGEMPRHIASLYGLEARTVSMILLRAKGLLARYLVESGFIDDLS